VKKLDDIALQSRHWFNAISEFHALEEIITALEKLHSESTLADYSSAKGLIAEGKKEMLGEIINFLEGATDGGESFSEHRQRWLRRIAIAEKKRKQLSRGYIA